MRRSCLLVLALSALPVADAWAQRMEFAATLGYSVPLRDQFDRAVVVMDRGIPIWGHYTGRQHAALVVGARGAIWPSRRFGFELLGSAYNTTRTVEQSTRFVGPARGHATVVSAAARLAVVVQRSESREIRVAFGPQVSFFSGAAYDSPPAPYAPYVALSPRSAWGGSAGIAMQYSLTRRVGIRAALDAAVYRIPLTRLTVADSTSTPLQLDLAPSIGVVIHTP
jgi:hypothetical protein